MTPQPYRPEPPWDWYRLDDLPDDWQVKTAEEATVILAATRKGRQPTDMFVLARPPESPRVAVMLDQEDVEEWALCRASNPFAARFYQACRAALEEGEQ